MVRYGKSRAKMPSRVKVSKRDWGKGMACSGRTKTCTIVGPEHAGPIPGIDCGMHWEYRMQCAEAGVHRPPVSGIAGSEKAGGCTSIVLGGGYEDDEDSGESFTYTGSGEFDILIFFSLTFDSEQTRQSILITNMFANYGCRQFQKRDLAPILKSKLHKKGAVLEVEFCICIFEHDKFETFAMFKDTDPLI